MAILHGQSEPKFGRKVPFKFTATIFHAVPRRFFHNIGTNITNYSVTAKKTVILTAAYLQHCCLEWKWRSGNQLWGKWGRSSSELSLV